MFPTPGPGGTLQETFVLLCTIVFILSVELSLPRMEPPQWSCGHQDGTGRGSCGQADLNVVKMAKHGLWKAEKCLCVKPVVK